MGPNTADIFVVRVPECNVEALRQMRDFVAESFRYGVLALPTDATLETIQVPALCGITVGPLMDSLEITCTQFPDLKNPAAEDAELIEQRAPTDPEETSRVGGDQKRAILQQLKEYRAVNGYGCLEKVAKETRTRGRISDSTLRALLSGDIKLSIEDWKKIGRALERLRAKEAADG